MRLFRATSVLVIGAALLAGGCGSHTGAPAASGQPGGAIASVPAILVGGFSCPVRGAFDASSGFYSQYYEDYALSYVFRDQAAGSYVDVGANDPDDNSVTKYFYLRGWRGVNIEPNPDMVARLNAKRPEDVTVGVGISDTPGTLTFYRFPTISGLSTFDRDVALQHKMAHFDELPIPVRTLNDVLDHTDKVGRTFTFMNVDVEGFEKHVLSSIDLTKHRPSVVMIEAMAPLTELPVYPTWEPILISAGYLFALDDGLNRYYVQGESRDLLKRFVEVSYCIGMDKVGKKIRLDGYHPEGRK